LTGFLNYYDALATGLKRASPSLRVGAPGGECKDKFDLNSYCWSLLYHVQNGLNYFTGRNDVPLDFISIHKKVSVI
jgi:Glycosyl hydrolases family 39